MGTKGNLLILISPRTFKNKLMCVVVTLLPAVEVAPAPPLYLTYHTYSKYSVLVIVVLVEVLRYAQWILKDTLSK